MPSTTPTIAIDWQPNALRLTRLNSKQSVTLTGNEAGQLLSCIAGSTRFQETTFSCQWLPATRFIAPVIELVKTYTPQVKTSMRFSQDEAKQILDSRPQ